MVVGYLQTVDYQSVIFRYSALLLRIIMILCIITADYHHAKVCRLYHLCKFYQTFFEILNYGKEECTGTFTARAFGYLK